MVADHTNLGDEGQSVHFEEEPEIPEEPEKPEIPQKPEDMQPGKPQLPVKTTSVATGDSANLIVLILCALLSCAVVLKCVRISRRK